MSGAERSYLREEDAMLPVLKRKSDVLDEEETAGAATFSDDFLKKILVDCFPSAEAATFSDDILKKILVDCFPSRRCNIVHQSGSGPANDSESGIVDMKISKGDHIDVISLLSWAPKGMSSFLINRDGLKVDVKTLENKYVVVCCVFLPLHYSFHRFAVEILLAIFAAASAADCPFQLVIVPKLRPHFDSLLVIQPFLDALPPTSLSIPYNACDHVCNSLHLRGSFSLAGLIAHPDGTILQTSCKLFREFGIEAFPFTDPHLSSISSETELLKCGLDHIYCEIKAPYFLNLAESEIALDQLLLCNPSQQLPHCTDVTNTVSVSTLRQRYVGLYLCMSGNFMTILSRLNLHILIVPLAFLATLSSSLDSNFLNLSKYNTSLWWLLPYNDRVYRHLWRLTDCSSSDKLIIVPPPGNRESGELEGRKVITCFGVDAFPFTSASILNRNLEHVRNLTLNHLFPRDNLNSEEPHLDMSKLEGKEVFICLNSVYPFYTGLIDSVYKIRFAHPDSVFVYVPPKSYKDVKLEDLPAAIDWKISYSCSNDVMSVLYNEGEGYCEGTIVAVKFGRIFSREAQRHLNQSGAFWYGHYGALWYDDYHLRSEILSDIGKKLDSLSD